MKAVDLRNKKKEEEEEEFIRVLTKFSVDPYYEFSVDPYYEPLSRFMVAFFLRGLGGRNTWGFFGSYKNFCRPQKGNNNCLSL